MDFSSNVPHGLCIGVDLPADPARLHPEERAFAETLQPLRRETWIGGRVALREALARMGGPEGPILATDRRAPRMPAGFVGSISHKSSIAVALVDRDRGWTIGVDVEEPGAAEIGPRILTAKEQTEVRDRPEEILVRFSLKEALYKALDPWVKRYVGYTEVEVRPRPDGSADVRWGFECPLHAETWWSIGPCILTTARVSDKPFSM